MATDERDESLYLRLLRTKRPTPQLIAEAAGISAESVKQARRTNARIDLRTADALAEAFGIPRGKLFGTGKIRPDGQGGRRAGTGKTQPSEEARRQLRQLLRRTDEELAESKIDRLKRESGLTFQEVADRAGISLGTLNRMRRGEEGVGLDKIQAVADVFEVSLDYLLES